MLRRPFVSAAKLPWKWHPLFFLLSCGLGNATAGEAMGKIKKLAGEVSIERAGKTLPASPGMIIEISDLVRTGAASAVGLTTNDNALVSLGPNSALTITRYAFNATTQEGRMDATLSKGSLSMVSGKLTRQSPEAVKITTPTAVLAVRGTEFLADIEEK